MPASLLAIDTATSIASVALYHQGTYFSVKETAQQKHAGILLPCIDKVLSEVGVTGENLDGIVFGRGPGGFTGLRIACSVAKALAYRYDLPIYGVSDLMVIAYRAFENTNHEYPILSVMDARMNQLYYAYFSNAKWGTHNSEYVADASDIYISEDPHDSVCQPPEKEDSKTDSCLFGMNITDSPFILAGTGFEPYRSQLPDRMQANMVTALEIAPDAIDLIALVLQGTIQPTTAAEAAPIYIRNNVAHGANKHG